MFSYLKWAHGFMLINQADPDCVSCCGGLAKGFLVLKWCAFSGSASKCLTVFCCQGQFLVTVVTAGSTRETVTEAYEDGMFHWHCACTRHVNNGMPSE